MLKRLLFCVALIAGCISVNAQNLSVAKDGGPWMRCDRPFGSPAVVNGMAKAPQKAASLEGTSLWGYYMGGIDGLGGLGVSQAATYWIAYFVEGNGALKGSSINGVNVPLFSTTNMKDFSVWISKDLNTNEVSKDVPMTDLASVSYNSIALDEPYAIPAEGVYVGVKFTISKVATEGDSYPVLLNDDGMFDKSLFMKTSVQGTTTWANYSSAYGAFGMQLFVSGVEQPAVSAFPVQVIDVTSLPGGKATTQALIQSDGTEDISSLDYVIEINGEKTSYHKELAAPISGGYNKQFVVELTYTAPVECVGYKAAMSIEKINGKQNPYGEQAVAFGGKVVSRMAERKTVVEEFTGTGCPWCPRGWVGMEMLKETQPNFIGIALHLYNSTDPMYVADYFRYDKIGLSGAPSCSVDRRILGVDPYYGSGNSITEDFAYCNSVLPEVSVDVTGGFNEDSTKVNVKSDIEYLMDGGKYSVAYVLVADSLKGETTAWRQANNYASATAAQVDNDPMLTPFCRGGEYGSSYVYLTFNDVMVGSSYSTITANRFTGALSGGENQADALTGGEKAGDKESNSYVLTMPTKSTLKSAVRSDELYVVALVIADNGTIANAARSKVMSYDDYNGTGISAVKDGASSAVEVARYTLNGTRITAPQKGINVVKMSNGEVRKVVVY